MSLKGEVGGRAFNSHGNYIVDHGKSWKNHGIVFFEFLWEPCSRKPTATCDFPGVGVHLYSLPIAFAARTHNVEI